jgi:ribosomal protein S6--L-glutamate ligase
MCKMKTTHLYLSAHPEMKIDLRNKPLDLDVVIPRLCDRHFNFGLIALKHVENMGIPVVNTHSTIVNCKNKYLTNLCLRKKRLPQPDAAVAYSARDMLRHLARMNKPFVLKLIKSSLGTGVSKLFTKQDAEDWVKTFGVLHQPLYIQEYIDHGGHDYRIMVLDGQVIGAEKRIAKPGEWKTNVSLGASVENYSPPKEIKEIAVKSAESVKGDCIGVDMIIKENKPYIIELNCFPYFKGLEKATGKNIGKKIIASAVRKARS